MLLSHGIDSGNGGDVAEQMWTAVYIYVFALYPSVASSHAIEFGSCCGKNLVHGSQF